MSRKFYLFNHYLMLVSIGLFLLICIVSVFCLIFSNWFSRDFWEWLEKFVSWAFPILLAIIALSSKLALDGFLQHQVKRDWDTDHKDEMKEFYREIADKRKKWEDEQEKKLEELDGLLKY